MKSQRGYRVIAELSVHPIGQGTSVGRYVKAAVDSLKKASGVRLMVTPMGTAMEAADLEDVLAAVRAAHESVFKNGAKRVAFTLTVDDRRDKKRRMEDKIAAVA
jgi:uncharacterized protein (TIGR00106 family)